MGSPKNLRKDQLMPALREIQASIDLLLDVSLACSTGEFELALARVNESLQGLERAAAAIGACDGQSYLRDLEEAKDLIHSFGPFLRAKLAAGSA